MSFCFRTDVNVCFTMIVGGNGPAVRPLRLFFAEYTLTRQIGYFDSIVPPGAPTDSDGGMFYTSASECAAFLEAVRRQ